MDSESQVETHLPTLDNDHERQQRLYFIYSIQQLMTSFSKLSTLLLRDDQSLPMSNNPPGPSPQVASPQVADTTRHRNQGNGSQARRRPKQQGTPDAAKQKHENRISNLKTKLETMYPEDGSPVVLLCWGEESASSILPVPVSSSGDEVAIWEALNKAWYTRRGYWRKLLPGFRVTRVDVAQISILGLKMTPKNREENEYIGMYTAIDIPSERRRLQNTIDINTPVEPCSYDLYTGEVDCGPECYCSDCFKDHDNLERCKVRRHTDAQRELSHLRTLNLMKHVFCNPNLAASNDFLEKGRLVYSQQKISSQIHSCQTWLCPALREVKFKGIVISDGWALNTRWIRLQFVVITSLGVVVAAKSLFSWDTAWTVGTFFVELMALLFATVLTQAHESI